MSINLPKPPKVISKDGFHATIEIEGLYPGYGMTLGNALRRVLLSSLQGSAVTMVKIKGVPHEFSVVPSVMEDVVEILLNIKQLRFKMHSDEPQKVFLKVKGEKEVTGKDIEAPSQVEVVNKSAYIATLTDKKAELDIEMTIEKGFGYVPVESRKKEKLEVGALALDAIFTPIRKVNYEVEDMRVGDRTDFNRLRVIIETDGTSDPEDAFINAAGILVSQFDQLTSWESKAADKEEKLEAGKEVGEQKRLTIESAEGKGKPEDDKSKAKVSELDIPSRVISALEEAGIKTVAGLVRKTESSLLEIDGMGDKGVSEIKKALKKIGLSLKEE